MADGNKEEDITGAGFGGNRSFDDFVFEEVLRFENGGTLVVILGKLNSMPAILQFVFRSKVESLDLFLELMKSKASFNLTNYSGAEYSYYNVPVSSPSLCEYKLEVIWPASERQIQRKRLSEYLLIEETPAVYKDKVAKHCLLESDNCQWIDEVTSLRKEKDRNLFTNSQFVINIDTKWTSHCDTSMDKSEWKGATWTKDIYILAVVKDRKLMSIRDLRGSEGISLCESMKTELQRVAKEVYGVDPKILRIYFHYHPQFYRLHAHCNSIDNVNPGCETERAHLLSTCISNLRNYPNYYEDATLVYKVRKGEKLYKLLE